jgi:hypothetical protein
MKFIRGVLFKITDVTTTVRKYFAFIGCEYVVEFHEYLCVTNFYVFKQTHV